METKEQKNESRTKEKKPLTEQQRQQRQKMLVYPLMVLLFAGCMCQGKITITELAVERARRSGAVTIYEQARVALHNSIILLEMLTNVKIIRDK